METSNLPASFRDPSGFVFVRGGVVFRRVNRNYKSDYDMLMGSGLYTHLTGSGKLIPHVEEKAVLKGDGYKTIKPRTIPFITYPYEWCFSELKDAALLTLSIQKDALAYGMCLKDASAFNIQFLDGKPVLIDTLSFEAYEEGKPWIAYKQFCEHFLAPLALAAFTDFRLTGLTLRHLDGIPLDLAAKLLPFRAKTNTGILMHVILHAGSQKKFTGISDEQKSVRSFGKMSLLGLVDNLESTVKGLMLPGERTVWSGYDQGDSSPSYTDAAFAEKKNVVGNLLDLAKPKSVWDLGANTGIFSRIAAEKGIAVVSMDSDYAVVEKNYRTVKSEGRTDILPLLMDLTNPTPSIGWNGAERDALSVRPHPDALMALALIHHLIIANNVPLPALASYFAQLAPWLIVEFIPKDDPQVRVLLRNRKDIFPDYTQDGFERAFAREYKTEKRIPLSGSKRILYLMQAKKHT